MTARNKETLGWSVSAKIGWNTGPREPNGCRLWMGCVNNTGYGVLKVAGGRGELVTRLILGLKPGDGLCACHTCDVRRCVEPSHLWAGTYADNNHDRHAKGRSRGPIGVANYNTKLNDEKVRLVLARLAMGETQPAIARDLGVNQTTVSCIARRETWRHVS